MEASLFLSGQDVPDDDGLWVLLSVHQRTEGHHIPETQHIKLDDEYGTSPSLDWPDQNVYIPACRLPLTW